MENQENQNDLENIKYQKIINFAKFLGDNIVCYIPDKTERTNARLNLELVSCYPQHMVIEGFSKMFNPKEENKQIIKKICKDYFIDFDSLKEEYKTKIIRYCEMFKKILN